MGASKASCWGHGASPGAIPSANGATTRCRSRAAGRTLPAACSPQSCLKSGIGDRAASSPSQSSLRDASSPKVGALGSPCKLHLFAKASPFGRGGCDHWEQTERASPLAAVVAIAKLLGSIQKIQAAALEDFLCFADLKSLARRNIRATACFYADVNAPAGSQRQQMLFTVTTFPVKMRLERPTGRSKRKYKIIFPLNMPRATRRAF